MTVVPPTGYMLVTAATGDVYVNADHLLFFRADGERTLLQFIGGETMSVEESVKEIAEVVDEIGLQGR